MCDYIDIEAIKAMVTDGWEFVRVGWPKNGEYYIENHRYLPIKSDITKSPSGRLRIIVKRKRWRAEGESGYWYIASCGVATCDTDGRFATDNRRYKIGNYYRTREEAEAAAVRVRKAYRGEGE